MLFHLWTGVRNFNDEIDKILDGSPVAAILYATGWIGVFGITTAGVLSDSFAFTTISVILWSWWDHWTGWLKRHEEGLRYQTFQINMIIGYRFPYDTASGGLEWSGWLAPG